MDGGLDLLVHVVAHHVAADAELLGVGDFHRGVEAAPEDHARGKAADHQEAEAVVGARPGDRAPIADRQVPHYFLFFLIMVSTSRKRFFTAGSTPSICTTWHCSQK